MKRKIIIDAMGGDLAPLEMVKGAVSVQDVLPVEITLVGDKEAIENAAKQIDYPAERFLVVHTPTVITMEDDPLCVTRAKSDSSMSVGLRMLAEGKGDAFVSAGNTGALFTGANLIVRKIKGVRRPAIAALLPLKPPVLLLDSGANVSVTPEYLEQFALMGSVYMQKLHGLSTPRIGLLNNGTEECKGTELQRDTYKLLAANPLIHFVGNVEGCGVMQNTCDVLVADGFCGNILLKTMEGMGKLALSSLKSVFNTNPRTKIAAAMVKDELMALKKNFDSGEYGGAPILGVTKPVIKAHGSSDAQAFRNAIYQAFAACEADLSGEISGILQQKKGERVAEKGEELCNL